MLLWFTSHNSLTCLFKKILRGNTLKLCIHLCLLYHTMKLKCCCLLGCTCFVEDKSNMMYRNALSSSLTRVLIPIVSYMLKQLMWFSVFYVSSYLYIYTQKLQCMLNFPVKTDNHYLFLMPYLLFLALQGNLLLFIVFDH